MKTAERIQWLADRRKGIGGSDVAGILGMSKFSSPMSVYLDKLGLAEEEDLGERVYWGTQLEDIVAKEFSTRTGFKVQRCNKILKHPQHPFMLANIDRFTWDEHGNKCILECKTTSAYNTKEWDLGVPEYYQLQVQHYLAVTGLQRAYVAVLIGGQEFRYFELLRDDELINSMIDAEANFWRLVEAQTPPAMDGSDSSTDILKYLYPTGNESEIELSEDAEGMMEDLSQIKDKIKELETQEKFLENSLKAELGDNSTGKAGLWTVTWNNQEKSTIDAKALTEAHPEIAKAFTRVSKFRVLRTKNEKEAV